MSNPLPTGIYSIDYLDVVWGLLVPPDKRQPNWLHWGIAVMTGKQWKGDVTFGSYANGAKGITPYYLGTSLYAYGDRVIFGIRNDGTGKYGDNGIYEWINNTPGSVAPSGANVVPDTFPDTIQTAINSFDWATVLNWVQQYQWVKVQDNFIGAIIRSNYNSQTMVFTYLLNLWFNTTFRQPVAGLSDIYIITNANVDAQFIMGPTSSNTQSFMAPASPPAAYFMGPVAVPLSSTDFTIYVPVAVYNSLTSEPSGYTTTKTNIVCAFANLINAAGMTYNVVTY